MNLRGLYKVFTRLDIKAVEELNGWLRGHCPLAPWQRAHRHGRDDNPSFGIHIDEDGASFFNCFTCKSKGAVSTLVFQLAKYRDEPELIEYGKQIQQEEIIGPEPDFGAWDENFTSKKKDKRKLTYPPAGSFERYPSVFEHTAAIKYLRSRGISFDTVLAAGLRFDPKGQRILFPVVDYWTGRYVGCSGRLIGTGAYVADTHPEPKVRDYAGLPKDSVLLGKPRKRNRAAKEHRSGISGRHTQSQCVYIVEGLFAYLKLVQFGFGTTTFALLGSVLTEAKAEIIKDLGKAVYWFTDDDPAGRECLFGKFDVEASEYELEKGALHKLYGELPQFIPTWPEGKTDPDELTLDEFSEMIEHAELYVK